MFAGMCILRLDHEPDCWCRSLGDDDVRTLHQHVRPRGMGKAGSLWIGVNRVVLHAQVRLGAGYVFVGDDAQVVAGCHFAGEHLRDRGREPGILGAIAGIVKADHRDCLACGRSESARGGSSFERSPAKEQATGEQQDDGEKGKEAYPPRPAAVAEDLMG